MGIYNLVKIVAIATSVMGKRVRHYAHFKAHCAILARTNICHWETKCCTR